MIPDDLSIPEFLRRPMTPECRALIEAQLDRARRSRLSPADRQLRRRLASEAELTERRIRDEADRRWRNWAPGPDSLQRPRRATFERLVRDEFKAKVARRDSTMSEALTNAAVSAVSTTEESVVGKSKTKKPRAKAKGAVEQTKKAPRAKKRGKPIIDARTGKPVTPETVGLTPDQVMADPPQTGGVRPGSKLETIVKLLQREGGCTTKDVLKATGWPSVSMPQQAKAAGLELRKEKVDGVTRYSVAA